MSDQTVFDTENKQEVPVNDYSALLSNIKNERGEQKYKNIEEALKALASSQEYIPKLHREIDNLKSHNSVLESQYEKALSIEEKINLLLEEQESKQQVFEQEADPPKPEPVTPPQQENSESNSFDPDNLYKDFRNRMYEEEKNLIAQKNAKDVSDIVYKFYGEKSGEYISNKATELGMSVESLKNLASSSPKAALSLLGLSGKREMNISNSYNSSNFKTTEDNEIRRNQKSLIGGTTADINNEFRNSSKMVEQLHERGMSINDLTNPQNYYKIFNK